MAINEIIIPYPDFIMGEVIDPEQFDLNNKYMVDKTNELIIVLNKLTEGFETGSGASLIDLKPIAPFVSTKVQTFLEEVIARLQSPAAGLSGASLIASTAIPGVTGTTVQAQLESLKSIVDAFNAHYKSEVQRLDGLIAANTADIVAVKPRVASLEGRATAVENRTMTNEGDIASLKTRTTTLENRTTALETGKANKTEVYTRTEIDAKKWGTANINDFSITSQKLANQSVTADKIHPSLVENASVSVHKNLSVIDHPDQSVTTAKIRDLNVTTAKLATQSVTTEKIAAEAVSYDKLGLDVQTAIYNADLVEDSVLGGKWAWRISNGELYIEQVE